MRTEAVVLMGTRWCFRNTTFRHTPRRCAPKLRSLHPANRPHAGSSSLEKGSKKVGGNEKSFQFNSLTPLLLSQACNVSSNRKQYVP